MATIRFSEREFYEIIRTGIRRHPKAFRAFQGREVSFQIQACLRIEGDQIVSQTFALVVSDTDSLAEQSYLVRKPKS